MSELDIEGQSEEEVKYKPSLFTEKPILGFCFRKDLYWLMFVLGIVSTMVFANQSRTMFHTVLDEHQASATNIFQLVICMCLFLACMMYTLYIFRVHPLFRVPRGSRATASDQECWYLAENSPHEKEMTWAKLDRYVFDLGSAVRELKTVSQHMTSASSVRS